MVFSSACCYNYHVVLESQASRPTNYLRFTTASIKNITATYVYSSTMAQATELVQGIISTALLNSIDQAEQGARLFIDCMEVDGYIYIIIIISNHNTA